MKRYVAFLAILALILAVILWLKPDVLEQVGMYAQQPQAELQKQALVFQTQHSQDFVRYKHSSEKNFSIDYPAGYMVLEEESSNVTVRFAAFGQDGTAEVINVLASPQTLSESEVRSDFENLKNNPAVKSPSLVQSRSVENGKLVLIGTFSLDAGGSVMNFVHATFPQCTDQNGSPYSATVTAAVPKALESDLNMVNYVIHSFEC